MANISFSGCGFLGLYHVGVIRALRDNAPKLAESFRCVGGSSAGALAGLMLVTNCGEDEMCSAVLGAAGKARSKRFGPLNPSFDLFVAIEESLDRLLPDDAHVTASGKLYVSLTAVRGRRNELISDFESREDLIAAMKASCCVPGWGGYRPWHTFRGKRYWDGGISNAIPVEFGCADTITVSPFSGSADICPQDGLSSSWWNFPVARTYVKASLANCYRVYQGVYPGDDQTQFGLHDAGYNDCLRYLTKQGLIEKENFRSPLRITGLPKPSVSTTVPYRKPSHKLHLCKDKWSGREACADCYGDIISSSDSDTCVLTQRTSRSTSRKWLTYKELSMSLCKEGNVNVNVDYKSNVNVLRWAASFYLFLERRMRQLAFFLMQNMKEGAVMVYTGLVLPSFRTALYVACLLALASCKLYNEGSKLCYFVRDRHLVFLNSKSDQLPLYKSVSEELVDTVSSPVAEVAISWYLGDSGSSSCHDSTCNTEESCSFEVVSIASQYDASSEVDSDLEEAVTILCSDDLDDVPNTSWQQKTGPAPI